MTQNNQILEDIDSTLFDTGISAEKLKARKISLARVLAQAKKALTAAEDAGETVLADKLRDKVDTLQELLDRADEVDYSGSEEDITEPGTDGADTDGEDDTPENGTDSEDPADDASDSSENDAGDGYSDGSDSSGSSSGSDSGADNESEPIENETDGKDTANTPEGSADDDTDNTGEHEKGTEESEDSEPESETDTDAADESDSDTSKSGSSSGTAGSDSDSDSDSDGTEEDTEEDTEDSEEDPEDETDSTKPKIEDKKVLIDPFKRSSTPPPKAIKDMLDNGELEMESVLDAAKRILSGLSGEARRGAVEGLKKLLVNRGIPVEESYSHILQEKLSKTLAQLSDDEFNDELSTTMELVDKILKVDYSDDLDTRIAEIKRDASSTIARMELEREDSEHVKDERAAVKAFDRENDKYKKLKALRGLEDFKANLYRAVKDQVEEAEDVADSWAALDRRHEDDPSIIKKGQIVDDVDEDIPSINVYFDQSGSWSNSDIEIGKRAISVINEFHENGEIKLNIFYMSAGGIFTESEAARVHGGAEGWADALQHIKASKVKNAIILSDNDLDHYEWSNRPTGDNGRTIIDGCVWWLWKNSSVSNKALKELIGRRGNFQYHFTASRY